MIKEQIFDAIKNGVWSQSFSTKGIMTTGIPIGLGFIYPVADFRVGVPFLKSLLGEDFSINEIANIVSDNTGRVEKALHSHELHGKIIKELKELVNHRKEEIRNPGEFSERSCTAYFVNTIQDIIKKFEIQS